MQLCWRDLFTFVYNNDMGGAEIVKAQGKPRLYQQVFSQFLEGLKAINSICWVHRDIHYRNILVVTPKPRRISEIRIKIADFGLARKVDATSQNDESTMEHCPHSRVAHFLRQSCQPKSTIQNLIYTAQELCCTSLAVT